VKSFFEEQDPALDRMAQDFAKRLVAAVNGKLLMPPLTSDQLLSRLKKRQAGPGDSFTGNRALSARYLPCPID